MKGFETFRSRGIEFVSLSQQIHTTTPTGKMVFTVLEVIAELDRSMIAERVRAGIRNVRAKGNDSGVPRRN
jgi:DNA invertase Pin-like site-specific DNA recombinase